ncbi:MAG: polysaccharide deacetylase family protein [Clostridia bacterium]|nr:polysaccharide deacetylase family protein [Clostridia bacterium]
MGNKFFFMRFPEGRKKALTFSYDDGVREDRRLVELLDKYGMKGTFNLNSGIYPTEGGHTRMMKDELTELLKDRPHEVATHAFSHPFLGTLPSAMIAYEIIKDREALEEQFGTIVRGHAYPMGSFNDKVIEVLRSCGVAYARTVASTEKFDLPSDWLRLNPTCHHKNPRLMELAQKFAEMQVSYHSKLFYLWGHSYEFNEKHDNNWHVIEEFCEYMGGRGDEIWYATNIEIFEYMEDFDRLIFSADGDIVKNPTARTLWFDFEGQSFSIAAGESFRISERRDPNVKGYCV